jgi:hypothetical protein
MTTATTAASLRDIETSIRGHSNLGRDRIVNEQTECDDASACLSVTHSGDWTRPDREKIKWRAVGNLRKHAGLRGVEPAERPGATVERPVAKTADNLLTWRDVRTFGGLPKAQAQSPKPK